jgi:ribosomal protein S18 acetylase RimI-like enzyme
MDKLATLRNVETLYLHVDTENLAALKLYFRNGFNLVDTKRGIYAEFTRKLNFHSDGNTMGRNYYLLKKDVQGSNTWC